MTEHIGDKLFRGPKTPYYLMHNQGLQSRNRLFTARYLTGQGFAVERGGKVLKVLGHLAWKNFLSGCACVTGWSDGGSPNFMFGLKDWTLRLDDPTTLLQLHDNGDLTISDRFGTHWRSETDVLDVPLCRYKIVDERFDPVNATPVGMTFDTRTVNNPTDVEQTHDVELSWEETETVEVKLDHSSEWEINSKVSVEIGLPFFNAAKGTMEVGGSYGQSTTSGLATSITKTVGLKQKVTIRAPPHTKMTASSTGGAVKVQGLRFNATMQITYADGSVEKYPTSGLINSAGIYTNYTVNYEQVNLQTNNTMPLAAGVVVDEQPLERREVVPEVVAPA